MTNVRVSINGILECEEIASDGSRHNTTYEPGSDVSKSPAEVQALAATTWTPDVLLAWQAICVAQRAPAPDYAQLRRAAYPPIGDQLDAIWKGGDDFVAMQKIVMAVKAQFPKP